MKYIGHSVDPEGLWPIEKKVKAAMEAPSPKNLTAQVIFGIAELQ